MSEQTKLLLPCPFCGKPPRITPTGVIYCCIASAHILSAWNTRAQPAAPDGHEWRLVPDTHVAVERQQLEYVLMRGSHLAKAAERYRNANNAFYLAQEDGKDDDDAERESLSESAHSLNSATYEYTKRADRLRAMIEAAQKE